MANVVRTMIEDGAGSVGSVPEFQLNKDGKISANVLTVIVQILSNMAKALNGRLTFGTGTTGHRTGNFDGQWIDVLTPSTPDTEFVVPHDLKRVPIAVEPALQDRAASLYASSLGSWDDTVIYLKCDTADATYKLKVY